MNPTSHHWEILSQRCLGGKKERNHLQNVHSHILWSSRRSFSNTSHSWVIILDLWTSSARDLFIYIIWSLISRRWCVDGASNVIWRSGWSVHWYRLIFGVESVFGDPNGSKSILRTVITLVLTKNRQWHVELVEWDWVYENRSKGILCQIPTLNSFMLLSNTRNDSVSTKVRTDTGVRCLVNQLSKVWWNCKLTRTYIFIMSCSLHFS